MVAQAALMSLNNNNTYTLSTHINKPISSFLVCMHICTCVLMFQRDGGGQNDNSPVLHAASENARHVCVCLCVQFDVTRIRFHGAICLHCRQLLGRAVIVIIIY